MSSGRKRKTLESRVTGTSREDILSNLTLAGNNSRSNLLRENLTQSITLSRDETEEQGLIDNARDEVTRRAADIRETVVDIPQDRVDSLNIRFQQRSNEVLRRNSFQGREQLVLTNRVN